MNWLIYALTVYVAVKVSLPGVKYLWEDTQPKYTFTSWETLTQLTIMECPLALGKANIDPAVFIVADWFTRLRQLQSLLFENQLQLAKVTAVIMVFVVPSSSFRLAVTIALVVIRWFELSIDMNFGIDVILIVAALVIHAVRS